MIALTFDDGPSPVGTPAILLALEAAEVRATFFVMGRAARAFGALLDAVVSAGHAVQLHCDEHVRHDRFASAEALERDTDRALATLAVHGVAPTQWRVPWALIGPDTEAVAAARGLQLVGWTADTEDWKGEPAAALLARVEPALAPGAVLLAHDGCEQGALRTDCAETAAWVALVVAAAREKGLDCGPVPASATAAHPPFARPRSAANGPEGLGLVHAC